MAVPCVKEIITGEHILMNLCRPALGVQVFFETQCSGGIPRWCGGVKSGTPVVRHSSRVSAPGNPSAQAPSRLQNHSQASLYTDCGVIRCRRRQISIFRDAVARQIAAAAAAAAAVVD